MVNERPPVPRRQPRRPRSTTDRRPNPKAVAALAWLLIGMAFAILVLSFLVVARWLLGHL